MIKQFTRQTAAGNSIPGVPQRPATLRGKWVQMVIGDIKFVQSSVDFLSGSDWQGAGQFTVSLQCSLSDLNEELVGSRTDACTVSGLALLGSLLAFHFWVPMTSVLFLWQR